jgi:hypothetical protein
MGEVALGWFIHLVDTGTGHIELPAVIHTAQARLLVASECERRPSVRTMFADDTEPTVRITEHDEVFAEEPRAQWRAVSLTSSDMQTGSQCARIDRPVPHLRRGTAIRFPRQSASSSPGDSGRARSGRRRIMLGI